MNTQKKFDMVSIVILTLLVSSEAIFKTIADLSIGLPIIGEIIFPLSDVYTFLIWGVVITWFIFKMGGWGKAKGLYLTIGGVFDLLGIPIGLAGGVAVAVYFANHPEVLAVAEVVAAPEAGAAGELGAAAEAGEAAETAASLEQAGATPGEAGIAGKATTEGAAGKSAAGEGESEAAGSGAQGEALKSGSEVASGALGEAPEPMEDLQQKLTGQNPVGGEAGPAGDKEAQQNSSPSDNDKKSDLEKERATKEARAEKIRKLMDKLPQGQSQQSNENQDDDDDYLAAAA